VDWRPASGEGVRIDHGLAPGQNVSPFYDPMLAKVIAHGATREEASRRLIAALEDTVALGLTTNRSFLIDVLRHPAFAAGEATTAFIDRHLPAGSDAMRRAAPDARLLGLAAVLMFEARARATEVSSASARWFSTGAAAWPLRLTLDDTPYVANIAPAGIDRYAVTLNDRTIDIAVVERQNGNVRFTAVGLQQTVRFAFSDDVLHLDLNGTTIAVRETPLEAAGAARRETSGRLVAPMNGAIVAVFAKPGDRVSRGQRIVVLEAMKMQHEIGAERDGTVGEILVKPGDQVATRQVLAVLAPEPATAKEHRPEERS